VQMDMGLNGLGVLVTAATGGIGRATTQAFASEGARAAVHYRSSGDAAEQFARESIAREVDGTAVSGDLSVAAEAEAVVQRLGRLDVLVCNAGGVAQVHEPVGHERKSGSARCSLRT
jgi:3-oxoacyl-[acyl-carrier protein] reductase